METAIDKNAIRLQGNTLGAQSEFYFYNSFGAIIRQINVSLDYKDLKFGQMARSL